MDSFPAIGLTIKASCICVRLPFAIVRRAGRTSTLRPRLRQSQVTLKIFDQSNFGPKTGLTSVRDLSEAVDGRDVQGKENREQETQDRDDCDSLRATGRF